VSIFPAKVLLATDGSEDAARARQAAIELCQQTGSELHVVHVGEPFYAMPGADLGTVDPNWGAGAYMDMETELERGAQKLLDEEVERVKVAGGTVAQAHLRMGAAAAEIVQLAEEQGAGLIVVGSRGREGIRRALMGSVSEAVVRHAHCPVLVVRE
jgi:nucleotide-binding universal stress UspA family protein